MTQVAAAILRREDGAILICQRGAGGSCAYLWEFPGGKREKGESMRTCAARECAEELGVRVAVDAEYGRAKYRFPDREIGFLFYEGRVLDGTPTLRVHHEMKWVFPEELDNYPFCPADVEIIERLKQEAKEVRQ